MAFISNKNSFSSGEKIDAPLFNQNFDNILLGLSDGTKDLKLSNTVVNQNVLVNKDFNCQNVAINSSFYCESAMVGGIIHANNLFLDGGFSLSGNSIVTVSTYDMDRNELNLDQSVNKLFFESYTSNVPSNFTSIKKISTSNFNDGDLVTLVYHGISSTTHVFTLLNSSPSGNLRLYNSDETFTHNDVFTFLYEGVGDYFIMISKKQN